jgi:hypothetical protein
VQQVATILSFFTLTHTCTRMRTRTCTRAQEAALLEQCHQMQLSDQTARAESAEQAAAAASAAAAHAQEVLRASTERESAAVREAEAAVATSSAAHLAEVEAQEAAFTGVGCGCRLQGCFHGYECVGCGCRLQGCFPGAIGIGGWRVGSGHNARAHLRVQADRSLCPAALPHIARTAPQPPLAARPHSG